MSRANLSLLVRRSLGGGGATPRYLKDTLLPSNFTSFVAVGKRRGEYQILILVDMCLHGKRTDLLPSLSERQRDKKAERQVDKYSGCF